MTALRDIGDPSFACDLKWSARALRRAPLLVSLTVVLAVPYALAGAALFLLLPAYVLQAGFAGTQRVWFARLDDRDTLETGEIWPMTRAFIGRFVVLGLEVFAGTLVPVALVSIALVRGGAPIDIVIVLDVVATVLVDVLLTFVVPALALTTSSVNEAWRIGLRMIRRTWPKSAWYVCAPGLTIVLAARAFDRGAVDPWAHVTVSVITAVVALWFKGAIVAFYVRRAPRRR